jgi:hypothetical protein
MTSEAIQELLERSPDASDRVHPTFVTLTLNPSPALGAGLLKKAIETVKLLNPAVASGAVLLRMLQVLLAVRQVSPVREAIIVQRGSLVLVASNNWFRNDFVLIAY